MYEAMTRKVPFEELGQENFNMGLFQVCVREGEGERGRG